MTAVVEHTRAWIEQFVVGLELCPFAAPVMQSDTLRMAVCSATDVEQLAAAMLDELDVLQRTPETELATSVLIFDRALTDFDDYLDFLALAETLLTESGLDGIVQIASFHPHYCFDGVAADDVSHYTNRSPYPMLHFLREATLTRALANYPDPEQIPQRNIDRLRALGRTAVEQRLERVAATQRSG
jgi:hypothetical protein